MNKCEECKEVDAIEHCEKCLKKVCLDCFLSFPASLYCKECERKRKE